MKPPKAPPLCSADLPVALSLVGQIKIHYSFWKEEKEKRKMVV
jgi:hypothetical protein